MSERPSNNTAGTPRLRVKDKAEPLLPIDKAAERPLWVVLIIMAFLAALALLSARMGERNYSSLQADLAGTATVQLSDITPENRLETAQQALAVINSAEPDLSAIRLSDGDAMALIEPWIDESLTRGLPDGIALPVLMSLSGSTKAQRDNIRSALTEAGITAVIDDHSEWSDDISRAARAFSIGSWLIMLLTFFASTAASVFATQSAMSAQSKTVAVFAQVGTPDNFITRLLMMRAVKVGAVSAAIGAIGALLFLALFRLLRGPSQNGLLPSLTPTLSDVITLIVLCVIFALICAAAAGASAKQMLSSNRLYS